jgi:hypothetical protein
LIQTLSPASPNCKPTAPEASKRPSSDPNIPHAAKFTVTDRQCKVPSFYEAERHTIEFPSCDIGVRHPSGATEVVWWESHDAIAFLQASRPVPISLGLARNADNRDRTPNGRFPPLDGFNGAAVSLNVALSTAMAPSEFDLKPPPSGSHERNIGLIIRQRHIAQHGVVVLILPNLVGYRDSLSLKVPGSRHQRHRRAALRSAQPAPTAL